MRVWRPLAHHHHPQPIPDWPASHYALKACLSHSIAPSRTMITSKRTRHWRSSRCRCSSSAAVDGDASLLGAADAGRGAAESVAGAGAHLGDHQQVPGAGHDVELTDAAQEIARDDGESLRLRERRRRCSRPASPSGAGPCRAPATSAGAAVAGGGVQRSGSAVADAHPVELAAHAALRIETQRAGETLGIDRRTPLQRAAMRMAS